jgi:hypothetical protein
MGRRFAAVRLPSVIDLLTPAARCSSAHVPPLPVHESPHTRRRITSRGRGSLVSRETRDRVRRVCAANHRGTTDEGRHGNGSGRTMSCQRCFLVLCRDGCKRRRLSDVDGSPMSAAERRRVGSMRHRGGAGSCQAIGGAAAIDASCAEPEFPRQKSERSPAASRRAKAEHNICPAASPPGRATPAAATPLSPSGSARRYAGPYRNPDRGSSAPNAKSPLLQRHQGRIALRSPRDSTRPTRNATGRGDYREDAGRRFVFPRSSPRCLVDRGPQSARR